MAQSERLLAKGGRTQKRTPMPGKNIFGVLFEGVESKDAAEALVGQTLMVPADDRPELEQGEYHLLDLVGLEARLSADGEAI